MGPIGNGRPLGKERRTSVIESVKIATPTRLDGNFTPPPFTSRIGNLLTLSNHHRLSLLQTRVDQHEIQLSDLNRKLELQRQVIEHLVWMLFRLREKLIKVGRQHEKTAKIIGMLVIQLQMIRMGLIKNSAYQEGIVQLKNLWKIKGPLIKTAILALACHGGLQWSQIYSFQALSTSLLLTPILGRGGARKAKILLNAGLLIGTVFLVREFLKDMREKLPFSLI